MVLNTQWQFPTTDLLLLCCLRRVLLCPAADVLAAPHGRVLFAGEATSTKMATALGALLSGQREAERIINMTRAAGQGGASAASGGVAAASG